jgi:diguanylate cyclase (GGDEF)-like protein/PAS domain S-box-containing protein
LWYAGAICIFLISGYAFPVVNASQADDVATLRIGVLAFRPKPETLERWKPLAEYLNHRVANSRFAIEALTYPELDAAVETGQLDFVLTQPSHYVALTYRRPLSSPLATLVERDGSHALDRFGGVIFARHDRDDINHLADLRGKTIATSSTGSLGSYQMQAFELARAEVHLPIDGKLLITGQPQDLAISEVLSGRADVGFVRTGVLEAMVREGKLPPHNLKIINSRQSPSFPFQLSTLLLPEWPVAAMPGVAEGVARHVAAALLSLPHDGAVSRQLGIEGFTIPGDYQPVNDLLRELRLPPFDKAPSITFADVWVRYRNDIILISGFGFTLLLIFVVFLIRTNRSMKRERQRADANAAEMGKLSLAVEQSPESIIITDLQARIEYVNAAFTKNTGYSRDEVLGSNPRRLQSGKTSPEIYQRLWSSLTSGQVWQGEFINLRKDGSEFTEFAIISPVRDADNRITHYLAIKQDITEKQHDQAEIQRLVYFDTLTGLPNRTLLMDRLEHTLAIGKRRKRQDMLILFNIDRFKTLNDARGAGMGDLMLKAVGGRLASLVRDGDTLARIAGDEFALLIQDIEYEKERSSRYALLVAEKIHASLRLPFLFGDEEVTITATLGITFFPLNADDMPQDIMQRAQTALHRAKEDGGNQTAFFDASMGTLAQQRFHIERELRRGIPTGELRLYLQSQVDPKGHIVGAEALVRWQHPERGLMPPGMFIGVAEESDLIIELETWVLSEACRLISQDMGHSELRLAVNISPRHFRQNGFVPWVKDLLSAFGVAPARLMFEVTEGLVIDNVSDVVEKMTELARLGIRFSIDDFGTGYSSLAYLKRLPIHELKIDKSFIQDITRDSSDAALVETILSVARHLQLQVVAEGVETREQAEFLVARSQLTLQGFLYSRPEPASDWIDRWKQQAATGPPPDPAAAARP